jgi:hypothetical protein
MEGNLSREWRPRRSVRLAVQITIRLHLGGRVVDTAGTDLNEHGLFLQTHETPPPDQPLTLEIALPEGPLTVEGHPRFIGHTIWGPGIGIEFAHSDEAQRGRWLKYVRSIAPLTPGVA